MLPARQAGRLPAGLHRRDPRLARAGAWISVDPIANGPFAIPDLDRDPSPSGPDGLPDLDAGEIRNARAGRRKAAGRAAAEKLFDQLAAFTDDAVQLLAEVDDALQAQTDPDETARQGGLDRTAYWQVYADVMQDLAGLGDDQ